MPARRPRAGPGKDLQALVDGLDPFPGPPMPFIFGQPPLQTGVEPAMMNAVQRGKGDRVWHFRHRALHLVCFMNMAMKQAPCLFHRLLRAGRYFAK